MVDFTTVSGCCRATQASADRMLPASISHLLRRYMAIQKALMAETFPTHPSAQMTLSPDHGGQATDGRIWK